MKIWDKRYFILFAIVGISVTFAALIYISQYLDKQITEQQAQARLKAYYDQLKTDCKEAYLNHEVYQNYGVLSYYEYTQCEKGLIN